MKTYIKERPIAFSADMVRALLQGWKTQTSRTRGLERFNGWPDWKIPLGEDAWKLCHFTEEEPGIWRAVFQDPRGKCPPGLDPVVKCPYGKPGERLWVREHWKVGLFLPWGGFEVEYLADGARKVCEPGGGYSAAWLDCLKEQCLEDCRKAGVKPWLDRSVLRRRQAMFLPRCASRILLEITDIEVRKLQSITEEEAMAEGIESIFYDEETSSTGWKNYLAPESMCIRARDSFFTLWDRLHGGGEADPWVWMIKFKVLEVKGIIK